MDPRRPLLLSLLLFFSFASVAHATGVFHVRHKYLDRKRAIADLRAHDSRRHGRILSAVDIPIGGVGLPTDTGLYYAEIGIGTPSKKYYVQVDTGSDILWVNCVTCTRCPKKSDIGIELTLYDPKGSNSASLVSCDDNFCTSMYGGEMQGCSQGTPCQYRVLYGDGSSTAGLFVTDFVQYNQVSGNHQTTPANESVSFGCSAEQSGDLGSSNEALDGIFGFGQSNSSMISQLAAAGKVRKVFAHCLDTVKGGGIFAIGNVVEPKVKTTPLTPNMSHYNVNLKAIEVGGAFLQLPTDLFETGDQKGTIIDSGTTLSYLPEAAYKQLMNAIFSYQPNLSFRTIQDFLCFQYIGSVDDGFPDIVFHFQNSLSLDVYPHDYLFQNEDDVYCVGWQNGGVQSKGGKDVFLLGDLVLSNKLVLYDLENQDIGWTEYNCSSSIQIKDDKTGAIYIVDAHKISPAGRLENCILLGTGSGLLNRVLDEGNGAQSFGCIVHGEVFFMRLCAVEHECLPFPGCNIFLGDQVLKAGCRDSLAHIEKKTLQTCQAVGLIQVSGTDELSCMCTASGTSSTALKQHSINNYLKGEFDNLFFV